MSSVSGNLFPRSSIVLPGGGDCRDTFQVPRGNWTSDQRDVIDSRGKSVRPLASLAIIICRLIRLSHLSTTRHAASWWVRWRGSEGITGKDGYRSPRPRNFRHISRSGGRAMRGNKIGQGIYRRRAHALTVMRYGWHEVRILRGQSIDSNASNSFRENSV